MPIPWEPISGILIVADRVIAHIEKRRDRAAQRDQVIALFLLEERQRQAQRRADREAAVRSGVAQDYPLGTPSRLRDVLSPDIVPLLLVSPLAHAHVPEGPNAVSDVAWSVLRDLDRTNAFVRPLTGGFVPGANGKSRAISGSVGAREIAAYEFDPHPSFIVYFTTTTSDLDMHVRVSNVVWTSQEEPAFDLTIARYRDGKLWGLSDDGDTTAVDLLSPDALMRELPKDRTPLAERLGWVLASFVAAVTWVYWEINGVRWEVVSEASALRSFENGYRAVEREGTGFDDRLLTEVAMLESQGEDVEVEHVTDGVVVLRAHRNGHSSVFFAAAATFPHEPPLVFLRNGDASGDQDETVLEEIELAADQWSSSYSLAQILEAFR